MSVQIPESMLDDLISCVIASQEHQLDLISENKELGNRDSAACHAETLRWLKKLERNAQKLKGK